MNGSFCDEVAKAHQPQRLRTTRHASLVAHRVWEWPSMLAIIALLDWLFLGHYTRRKHLAGSLVLTTGLIRITTRAAGAVAGLRIAEDANVSVGQLFLAVVSDRSSEDICSTDTVGTARLLDQQVQLRAAPRGIKRESAIQASGLRQHMEHLDYGTDGLISTSACNEARPYRNGTASVRSSSETHWSIPATCSISGDALAAGYLRGQTRQQVTWQNHSNTVRVHRTTEQPSQHVTMVAIRSRQPLRTSNAKRSRIESVCVFVTCAAERMCANSALPVSRFRRYRLPAQSKTWLILITPLQRPVLA
jgi:hypothetical protein